MNEDIFQIDGITLVVFVFTLFLSIVIHELAHAISCKHYGGEVHKMGLLLFYFTPAFYADVSDIYFIESKRKRVIICLAGIFTNIILANVSIILYFYFYSKDINITFFLLYYLFNLGTGIYNLFPFVKMDGYWVLQSLFGEQNLMDKSKTLLFMMIFKNKEYRKIRIAKGRKISYLVFGAATNIAFVFFWYMGLEYIGGFVNRVFGNVVTYMVIGLLTALVIASFVMQFKQYNQLSKQKIFNEKREGIL